MQAPAEAVELTSAYVRICGVGIFFIVAYNVLAAIFRGLGDSKSPLVFVAVGLCHQCCWGFGTGGWISYGRSRSRYRYGSGPGCQRNICSGAVRKEESSFPDQKGGFSF